VAFIYFVTGVIEPPEMVTVPVDAAVPEAFIYLVVALAAV
jgi:hypothetical protein